LSVRYNEEMSKPLGRVGRIVLWFRSPSGHKVIKYAAVSVISTLISQLILFISYGILSLASAVVCNILANAIAAGPSYYLNRSWVWKKTGRSHALKEILPFWLLAFAGMGLSIGTVALAAHIGQVENWPHLVRSGAVNAANLLAFGTIWVLKLVIYDRVLFGRPESRLTLSLRDPLPAIDPEDGDALELDAS
jgi:putative flippase GtrA